MPETWRGTVESAVLVRMTDTRRVLLLAVRYVIISGEGVDLHPYPMQIRYPVRIFRGLTRAQAWQMIRDDGAGTVPSLRQLGNDLLTDWTDGAAIRQIEVNQEIGPR